MTSKKLNHKPKEINPFLSVLEKNYNKDYINLTLKKLKYRILSHHENIDFLDEKETNASVFEQSVWNFIINSGQGIQYRMLVPIMDSKDSYLGNKSDRIFLFGNTAFLVKTQYRTHIDMKDNSYRNLIIHLDEYREIKFTTEVGDDFILYPDRYKWIFLFIYESTYLTSSGFRKFSDFTSSPMDLLVENLFPKGVSTPINLINSISFSIEDLEAIKENRFNLISILLDVRSSSLQKTKGIAPIDKKYLMDYIPKGIHNYKFNLFFCYLFQLLEWSFLNSKITSDQYDSFMNVLEPSNYTTEDYLKLLYYISNKIESGIRGDTPIIFEVHSQELKIIFLLHYSDDYIFKKIIPGYLQYILQEKNSPNFIGICMDLKNLVNFSSNEKNFVKLKSEFPLPPKVKIP